MCNRMVSTGKRLFDFLSITVFVDFRDSAVCDVAEGMLEQLGLHVNMFETGEETTLKFDLDEGNNSLDLLEELIMAVGAPCDVTIDGGVLYFKNDDDYVREGDSFEIIPPEGGKHG